jgi:DNA-binding MarR family transcriptional regulator
LELINIESTVFSHPVSGEEAPVKPPLVTGAGLAAPSANEENGAAGLATRMVSPEGLPPARFELRILRALRRIIHSVDLYSKELAATNKVTAPQLICLLHVVNSGPVSATAIGREVHLSPSTVVGILDRLEEKGLVERQRSREDRRIVRVTATREGVELSRKAPSPLQQTLANSLAELPELEQATIALSLERIVALMEAPEVDAAPILATGPINPAGP